MKKSSQIQPVDASALPERVSVAMGEIAEDMHEGLLALAVGAGLQVMAVLMEADVTALAGPRGRHDATRTAVRHGRERGSVTLGGRRVSITRPRVRAADGAGEVPVAGYELFSSTEMLGRMAMEQMLAGVSSRRYPVGLEPVGDRIVEAATSTSKSAVSRKFVAMTETALADLLSRGPGRAGPGRGDDRRGALRRVPVRGRAGHRYRWGQAPAGAGGGLDGECDPGHRAAGRAARAGAGCRPCSSGSTGPRRCARPSSTCSTARSVPRDSLQLWPHTPRRPRRHRRRPGPTRRRSPLCHGEAQPACGSFWP